MQWTQFMYLKVLFRFWTLYSEYYNTFFSEGIQCVFWGPDYKTVGFTGSTVQYIDNITVQSQSKNWYPFLCTVWKLRKFTLTLFKRNLVKALLLPKNLLKSWFHEKINESSKFFVFPHCALQTTIRGHFIREIFLFRVCMCETGTWAYIVQIFFGIVGQHAKKNWPV